MGWKLKGAAFLFGLFALSAGSILVALPVFLWVFWPWIRGIRRRGSVGGLRLMGGGWTYYAAFFLLFLALVAFVGGGTLSPVVFGGAGTVLLLYGRGRGGSMTSWTAPVEDSVLLRDRFFPFGWTAVAEVKSPAFDAAKVLPAINELLVLKTGGEARAYVVLRTNALSEREAEAKVVSRLREIARVLLPLGAYLMPLKGSDAFSVLRSGEGRTKLDLDNLDASLASAPYDALTIKPRGHVVEALGAYQSYGVEGRESIMRTPQVLGKPVLIWEVVSSVDKRVKWAAPDEEAAFVSSLAATKGAHVGERLVDVGSDAGSRTLMVRSLNTPPVELGRAQVRALVRVYS